MKRSTATILTLLLVGGAIGVAHARSGPEPERPASSAAGAGGIKVAKVAGPLADPAGFTFLPDGRIVYLERATGRIRLLDPSAHTDRVLYRIPGVNGDGERGTLGVAVSPAWPSRKTLWVYVTRGAGGALRNQLLRISLRPGHGAGMVVLLSQPASADPYHNGGRILFGPDGKLYVFIGDGHDSANAQDLAKGNLRGKLLRVNPDGSAPADNPIPGKRFFSFGNRNSFGFTFDPQTGSLWQTENGPECNDEINLITPGANDGWGPNANCSGSAPGDTNNSGPAPRSMPKWFTPQTIGITGAAFCDGCGLGASWLGALFVGAANDGVLRVFTLNGTRSDLAGGPQTPLTAPNGAIYSIETAPDGRIYFSDFLGIYRLVPA